MKIVHISNTDSGGAFELHQAMLEGGLDSTLLIKHEDRGSAMNTIKIPRFNVLTSAIGYYFMQKIMGRKVQKRRMFSLPFIGSFISRNEHLSSADAIYLHFVAHGNMLSFSELRRILALGKPTLFITRDYWPFTGGCHIPMECEKFKSICKNCPHFESSKIFDFAKYQFKKKLNLYKKFNNLSFIALSNANYADLSSAKLSSYSNTFLVHNCINIRIFDYIDKMAARKILGLKTSNPIVGFGARDIGNPDKGFSYLIESLERIKSENNICLDLVTYGKVKNGINVPKDLSLTNLGYLKDKYSLALFYNAIDVFVTPSLAETFGNATAESLACGTPVVGFRIGGTIDIIDHDSNGYLAEPQNEKDLAFGILKFLQNSDKENTKVLCRNKILRMFSREIICNKHVSLLKEVINRNIE